MSRRILTNSILARLGPKEDNPKYGKVDLPALSRPSKSLYLLIGVVLLTVGVIGGLAFRLFKQTQV